MVYTPRRNEFILRLLELQQDGQGAISAPINWKTRPLLDVPTQTDEVVLELARDLLGLDAGKGLARWHFFVGAPGNGKSAAVGKLCRYLIQEHGCVITNEQKVPIDELGSESIPYLLRVLEPGNVYPTALIVQDASVVRDPFAAEVDPAAELITTMEQAWNRGVSLVICANRGVLDKAYGERYLKPEFNSKTWFNILEQFIGNSNESTSGSLGGRWHFTANKRVFEETCITYTYMDNQSLLLGSNTFERLVEKATASEVWEPCNLCAHRAKCPFKLNQEWLSDPTGRSNVLRLLKRAEVWSGQIVVFREAIALLSFLLAGCSKDYGDKHPCDWVHDRVISDDIFALAIRRIYMSLFSSFAGYGLEAEGLLLKRQKRALEAMKTVAAGSGQDFPKSVEHVLTRPAPSTDVGVGRLLGGDGAIVDLDPCLTSLTSDFLERWDGNPAIPRGIQSHLFTDLERHCLDAWSCLEEVSEYSSSYEAPDFYWAVRRWSSNFILHFGAMFEGLTAWSDELDEFLEILEITRKPLEERSRDERWRIAQLNGRLEQLLITSTGRVRDESLLLSESVRLSGRWVSDTLRPKISARQAKGNLSLWVEFSGEEVAMLGARAYVWLYRHLDLGLSWYCFPTELLVGVNDARIRAASKGDRAYAFADSGVHLTIVTRDGALFTVERMEGDVFVGRNGQ